MNHDTLPPPEIRRAIEQKLFGGALATWNSVGGGLSAASLWRATAGGEAFAVRRWPSESDLARRDAVLKPLLEEPLSFVAATRIVHQTGGEIWESTTWIEGTPLSETDQDDACIRASMNALAEFHRAAWSATPVGLQSNRSAEFRLRRLKEFRVPKTPQESPGLLADLLHELVNTLPAAAENCLACSAWPPRSAMDSGIHGDARPEHFLLKDSVVVGLIDWGAAKFDSPLVDVARLAGELALGDQQRFESIVSMYEDASGEEVPRPLVRWLDASGAVLSGANWLGWLGDPNFKSRDPELVRQRLRSILARLPRG